MGEEGERKLFLFVIFFWVESLYRLLFFVAGEWKSAPDVDGEGNSAPYLAGPRWKSNEI
jgi:hypothetical protein